MVPRFSFGEAPQHRFAHLLAADRRRLTRVQDAAWDYSRGQVIVFGPGLVGPRQLVTFEISADLRPCHTRADVALHLAGELRRLAYQLAATARRLEGGAS